MVGKRLCQNPQCLNPARPHSRWCRPCALDVEEGRVFHKFCKTCLHPLEENGECLNCARILGEKFAAMVEKEDPRIAKLRAVANDPSATPAEKESALNLIRSLGGDTPPKPPPCPDFNTPALPIAPPSPPRPDHPPSSRPSPPPTAPQIASNCAGFTEFPNLADKMRNPMLLRC